MAEGARSVLVVDDEEDVATVVSRHLEAKGWRCAWAASAEAAVKLLSERSFDCILLDNSLPGAMGITALPAIAAATQAPIVMMTGYPDEDVQQDALLLGAKGFIAKPIDFAALAALLDGLAGGGASPK